MTIHIEYMALSDLLGRFHPDNPKDHDLGAIIQSLKTFGYVSPGAIDEVSGLFVEGHGRTQATYMMQQQQMKIPKRIEARNGDWYLPVVRGIEFETPEQVKAYLVASNRLVELGGWDELKLTDVLEVLLEAPEQAHEPLFPATGFDEGDLQDLRQTLERRKEKEHTITHTPITGELLERHDYIVIYFDNQLDWQAASEWFALPTVKDAPIEGSTLAPKRGVGRAVPGKLFLSKIFPNLEFPNHEDDHDPA